MSLPNYNLYYAKVKLQHVISSLIVHLHMWERKRPANLTRILAGQSKKREIFISLNTKHPSKATNGLIMMFPVV